MRNIYFHSYINRSASRASVKIVTPKSERFLANVFKRDGFWHIVSELGVNLLKPIPHTTITKTDVHELPLGAVIKLLREAVTATASVRNAA